MLKKLYKSDLSLTLIYPKNNLKKTYFKRFKNRGSNKDFLNTLNKHWDKWIDELKEQNYCKHIILSKGQYLEEVLNF